MTRRKLAPLLAACALAALALTGCSGHPRAAAPNGVSAGTVQQMQQQVDAAQSAADAADSDAATDPSQ
ncbi:hypothetical protein ACEZCY_12045 [Streptacidiphilus sp. N1-12]|uniref:Uncharacterized protein n=2 Tax=Streptacidiphilus alkalitolerans TaxID=3342712 RepID=A0ABV6WD44_9ACTN